MNKVINFSILYVSLFTVEIIVGFLLLFLYSSNYKGNFDGVILWNFWRVLFYGLPFVIFYILFFKYFGNIKIYKPLLFSFFNLVIYILMSYLSEVIWGKNVPLPTRDLMFWITCISIIISPLILGQIPYFRRLMESI
jgi:hypothetical protein